MNTIKSTWRLTCYHIGFKERTPRSLLLCRKKQSRRGSEHMYLDGQRKRHAIESTYIGAGGCLLILERSWLRAERLRT